MTYSSRRQPSSRRQRSYAPHTSKRKNTKENIHPSRFIKAARSTAVAAEYAPQQTFEAFTIHGLLRDNLQAKGILSPSPIQDQAIPVGLAGQDVIGVANTGTGKTLAFAIPVLQKLLTDRTARALIMAPTRELASQIEDAFRSVAKGSSLSSALLIGGSSMGVQLRDLSRGPSIVIGTPGRIKDHLARGSLKLSGFSVVVLDEVDRMLDMGFVHSIRDILAVMPLVRQSFFFSATLDTRVNSLIGEFSHDPVTISVKTGETIDTVEQDVVRYTNPGEKMDKLHDLLLEAPKVMVFHDTKWAVERLSQELQTRGFQADAIHGGKSQSQRQRALKRFKENDIKILVATDVAARGIDVDDVTHVVNYSTPQSYTDYIHRIGRAGRAGKAGYAFTFVEA